jgi:hypothetical protein
MTSKLPIPIQALEDCGAILGRRGAGKSGTGRALLEHELTAGHRCCVIDPKGDWHGIRMLKDGKPSPFQVPIFGGAHGDLELTEDMGDMLGKMIANHDLSCVVDLSAFPSLAAMRRFALGFASALYKHNRAPLTLFVDECDQLAPQVIPREDNMAKLLHAMESLIRQGRQRGIFMWMLTQRPQVLNKNLLSQAETLIAMRMTSPHDCDAIRDWMKAHDPEQAKHVMANLSKLDVGEAFAWVPGADFLERVQFPLFRTFDSGRTPKHGEKIASISLPTIDLSAVEKALESVKPAVKETKKQDKPRPSPEEFDKRRDEVFRLRTYNAELESKVRELKSEARELTKQLDKAKDALATIARIASKPVGGGEFHDMTKGAPAVNNAAPSPRVPAASAKQPARDSALGAERKPLASLVQVYPSGLTDAQWRVSAGFKDSGTWSTYKSRLRSAGLIEEREGKFFATDSGANAVGEVELPPAPGPELVRWWVSKLQGVAPMAEALIEQYPAWLMKEDLGERIGMTQSGTFSTYLSRLAGPGLIDRDRERGIRLSPTVMEGT